MFATHCHLDDAKFDHDQPATLQRAFLAGVTDILIPSIRPATFDNLIHIVSSTSPVRLHLALGFHPQVVPELSDVETLACKTLTQRLHDSRAVAVDECGLDGPTGRMELQEQLFRAQIRIALVPFSATNRSRVSHARSRAAHFERRTSQESWRRHP